MGPYYELTKITFFLQLKNFKLVIKCLVLIIKPGGKILQPLFLFLIEYNVYIIESIPQYSVFHNARDIIIFNSLKLKIHNLKYY